MSRSIAILGKGGVGKTFLAAHLGMALGYLGDKTLVVGCDQKRDTIRALSAQRRPSLVENLEQAGFDYARFELAPIISQITENVDALELGPSQLLVGHTSGVLEEALHLFDQHGVFSTYQRILFDVNDERFDASHAPLLRRVETIVAVTDDTPESLFVLNRLLRALLIGSAEHNLAARLLGVVHNRAVNPQAFEHYVELSNVFPLLSIGDSGELARLRPQHRTLFALEELSPELNAALLGMLKIAELLRGDPLNLYPIMPLDDEEIWRLAPHQPPEN
ncbi:MAG: hypothetical protein O7A08_04145 [SAR324 cluster bacterium]|nr:hypothetical protein [SAR324 cluster bacterium]